MKTIKKIEMLENKALYIFGDLGYISKDEYLKLLDEGQRKATGRQKNFF